MREGTLKHGEITNLIIKGFYEVYNELGAGFLESVYENALYIVLRGYGLSVEKQKGNDVLFRGISVGEYRADLIVDDTVVVEVKAVESLVPAHGAQLMNYMRATKIEVGVLLDFGAKPEFKRFLFDNIRKKSSFGDNP